MDDGLKNLTLNSGYGSRDEDAFDLNALLHPAQAFSHPSDVVNDPDLTLNESGRSLHPGHLMRARSSPHRRSGARLLKVASRLPSTTSWTHFAPWMLVRREPATATAASCANAAFSAAAAARAVTGNLFIRGARDVTLLCSQSRRSAINPPLPS